MCPPEEHEAANSVPRPATATATVTGATHDRANDDQPSVNTQGASDGVSRIDMPTTHDTTGKGNTSSVQRESEDQEMSCLARVSGLVTLTLEEHFEGHGRRVAAHPLTAAAICLLVTVVCGLGLNFLSLEQRPFRLWLPQDSEFIKVMDWQAKNFPTGYRRQLAVWEADNVLTAEVVQEMWRLHTRVAALTVGPDESSWHDLCVRVPTLPVATPDSQEVDYEDFDYGVLGGRKRRRRREQRRDQAATEPQEDLSLTLPREQYCESLNSLPKVCLETGLLEVWGLDEDSIMALTDDQVIRDLNEVSLSQVFGYRVDFTKYLGGVTYDEAGRVVSARAATHVWLTSVDNAALRAGDSVVDSNSGELVDAKGFAWEQEWVAAVLNDTHRPAHVKVNAQAASSFGMVSDNNIWGDVKWLVAGMVAMSVFVNMTLGRRNLVQQRPLLAFLGMSCVFQAVLISYGFCSFLGIPYCTVNSILPILLLGLGVDDMFIIMAAWEAAGGNGGKDLVERAGRTMRHAGVAITVTSLTDVTAFAVGATTALPALRSFCLYAAVGILAVFILQATFFLAWLVIDERRLAAGRNGMLWCLTHRDWSPSPCSQRDLISEAFRHFCRLLLSPTVRVSVVFCAGVLLVASLWTATNLRREFNPVWLIPTSSYLHDTFRTTDEYFPGTGNRGYVYFANVSLPEDLPQLYSFTDSLVESNVVSSVDAWFIALREYMSLRPQQTNSSLTRALLQDTLSLFLQSSIGATYREDFSLDGALDCRLPAPPITSFRIGITHQPAESPAAQAAALGTINSLVSSVPVGEFRAVWAHVYAVWETNEVVGKELLRNVLVAGTIVGGVTLVLLASPVAALLVVVAVAATVTGVAGTMWLWGLTIDTVSCIAVVLAIGLSVDYAAHVAYAFLAAREAKNRLDQARIALEGAGPAVLKGGLSTMLSFVVLGASTSHVFITFFKVFTAASVLGLFYGLIVLPVVLSFIGPPAYPAPKPPHPSTDQTEHYTNSAFSPDQPPLPQAIRVVQQV